MQYLVPLLLCFCLVQGIVCDDSSDNLLYESSNPDRTWPPEGQNDFSGPPESWPGHGERLGKSWPREKVPSVSKTPDHGEFFAEYVDKRRPLVLKNLWSEMTKVERLNMKTKDVINSGRAALSVITAQAGSGPDPSAMTFRDFLRRRKESGLMMRDHMHVLMKTQMGFPSLLKCYDVTSALMHDTRHVYDDENVDYPMQQDRANHQLVCQVEGEREVLLTNEQRLSSWEKMSTTTKERDSKRTLETLNPRSVDFKANPGLKEIDLFQVAHLKAGQCLYIPAGSIHQQTVVSGPDHALEINWRATEGPSEFACKRRLSPAMVLGDVAWPGEGVAKPLERTSDKVRTTFNLLSHIIDMYVLNQKLRTYDDFVQRAKKDVRFVKDLLRWDDECEDVAKAMFVLVDRNGDGVLDAEDLTGLEALDLAHWAGLIYDRTSELAEISFDMIVDTNAPLQKPDDRIPDAEEYIRSEQERQEQMEKDTRKSSTQKQKKATKDEL